MVLDQFFNLLIKNIVSFPMHAHTSRLHLEKFKFNTNICKLVM